jgi:hypothetical protein
MKTIKDLDVKVTYKVGLGDVEVPNKVYEQLYEIYANDTEVDIMGMSQYPEASEWLRNNIKVEDCCDLEYSISELS